MLGVKPAIGRWLRTGEDIAASDGYVMLSHGFWITRYKGDASVVGRFVELDGVRREIVGVMPASFQFPSARTQVWVPLGLDSRNTASHWGSKYMPIVGRLRPGATAASALSDVTVFQSRIRTQFRGGCQRPGIAISR